MANLLERIDIKQEVQGGRPIIKGTRITVKTVLEYVAAGESTDNIVRHFPPITKEDIMACVAFAAKMLEKDFTIKELA